MKYIFKNLKEKTGAFKEKINKSSTEKNRFILLIIALLFIFDYFAFCLHIGKNPMNIFPSIPVLESKRHIDIYLPDLDGASIIKEKREVSVPENEEGFIRLLVDLVVKGSIYENTASTVPVKILIRGIWLYNKSCIIDLGLSVLSKDIEVITGTEGTFRKALERTLLENIRSLEKVQLLVMGIPFRNIWEVGSHSVAKR